MTDIIELAEQAGFTQYDFWDQQKQFERFAELVRQDERETLKPAAWRKKVNGVWHYFDESTPFPCDDCEPLYEKH